ncbi:MAG TPA: hypothetical protein VGL21_02865 [Jatrophihabitantaceae bacterium]|jgi:hypothetical protein
MKILRTRPVRVILCAMVATGGVMAVAPSPAIAANTVSQATAQAVNLNLLQGALKVALSNPATSASNDGTQSNAEVHAQPLIAALNQQKLLEVGALAETAEANQDGSSYGCAGIVGRGGQIQIGDHGKTCTPIGAPNGGVTIDLGELPGASPLSGLLRVLGVPTIKITVDSLTAHGYEKGTDPAILGATVANVHAHLGRIDVPVHIGSAPNQDLLSAVLGALSPSLGLVGAQVSNLLKGLVELTTNYQPEGTGASAASAFGLAAAPKAVGKDPSVSALHISLLNNSLAEADLAKVTVGPNAATGDVDAFSFSNLPIIFGGIAALIALGYGLRFGVRRVRGAVA